jgi:putative hemolysin
MMNLTQWQTKPGWPEYEAALLAKGFAPYWDEADAARLAKAGFTTCDQCGGPASYVGMTDGKTRLGFVVCCGPWGAYCEEWIFFLAPLRDLDAEEE